MRDFNKCSSCGGTLSGRYPLLIGEHTSCLDKRIVALKAEIQIRKGKRLSCQKQFLALSAMQASRDLADSRD